MSTRIEALIKELLQALASELDLLVRQRTLEALRSILEGSAVSHRRDRRPEYHARVPKADDLAERITSAVAASPGQTVSEIGNATGARSTAVMKAIKTMLDSGELRKTGHRRATRYFPPGAARLPGAIAKRRRRGKRRGRKAAGRPATGARKARKTLKPKRKKAVLVPTRRRPLKRPAAKTPAQQAEAPQLHLGFVHAEQSPSAGAAE